MGKTQNEIWKSIPNFDYEVSNNGRIRSLDKKLLCKNNTYRNKKGIVLKQSFDKDGYLRVALSGVTKKSHRLVATVFIPNPDNLPEINHNDGDKTNNNVYNLQWCTHKYNIEHSCNNNLHKKGKDRSDAVGVTQKTKDNKIVNRFGSIREAERLTGISNATISKVCKGIGNIAGGFKWEYSNFKFI